MSATAITVEHLSKTYLVGHKTGRQDHARYTALRDAISREMRNAARRTIDAVLGRQIVQGDTVEEFWALNDVSFEVKRGEVLGIIGRNGAGKSTLLKILSRITEPTRGRVVLHGRVTSLLEVGTGFHSELTGRENIYLNGSILGMTRPEILKKFDEIVAFAEVEKFLDTPTKYYSSGMYVRLAFAVAAHLDPEILIVDEVLAVGDAEFHRKCLGKMDEVSRREGRTVLFVSHNLAAIAQMADRALLLAAGSVQYDGGVSDAISTYLLTGRRDTTYVRPNDQPCASPHLARVEVLTSDPRGLHQFGKALEVKFWIRHQRPMSRGCFGFQICNRFQSAIAHAFAYYPDYKFGGVPGYSLLVCRFPELILNVGEYYLRTWLQEPPDGEVYERLDGICTFEVIRLDQTIFGEWPQDVCAYHEKFDWTTIDALVADEAIGLSPAVIDDIRFLGHG
jgi:lipopolysaccharide transport system ATP-binding protein